MLTYWPELTTGAALFAENNYNRRFNGTFYGDVSYGSAEPSDPGLFYGIDEYAKDRVKGRIKGKYTPLQVRNWLQGFANDVRGAVSQADPWIFDPSIGDPGIGRRSTSEFRALRLDLLMLADLATYHTEKILAAVALGLSSNPKGAHRRRHSQTRGNAKG